ncbi:low molecular weight phosphatase family protein [Bacillus sp. Hm123]|uniref:arsenate-mycothiol transferase ArsC n=1 Tax=Bacillus sp. Hm123 TaxID=3450745 RepID=UPI003F432FD4
MYTKRILFLSPINHLSIMAEGWASRLHAPMLTFISASCFHASEDHLAISAMQEVNIDISYLQAKPMTAELLNEADLVISIYDFSRDEQLDTSFFDQKNILHWNIPNPSYVQEPIEKWATYQVVCDTLADYVKGLQQYIK